MKQSFFSGLLIMMTPILKAADIHVSPSGFYGGAPCYTTIQHAIDDAAAGDQIHIHSGTYQENIRISKSLTLTGDGTGSTLLMPAISDIGDPGNYGTAPGSSDLIIIRASNVSISNITLDGSNPGISGNEAIVNGVAIDARNGIVVADDVTGVSFGHILLDQLVIRNIFMRGVRISSPTVYSEGNIIQNTVFENIEGNAGSFGMFLYWSNGKIFRNSFDHANFSSNWGDNIEVSENTFSHTNGAINFANAGGATANQNQVDCQLDGSSGIQIYQAKGIHQINKNIINNCSYGVLVEGSYTGQPVYITDNTINGNTGSSPLSTSIGIFTTTEVIGEMPGESLNVAISGNNIIENVNTGIVIESSNARRDDIDGPVLESYMGNFVNTTTLTGTRFINAGRYIVLQKTGAASTIPNIDATTVSFDSYTASQADGFSIEDRIHHKMDNPSLGTDITNGLVVFSNQQIFVTYNDGNDQIQRAVDNAPADGWTANIKAGYTNTEDVHINKSIILDHDGSSLTIHDLWMDGEGKNLKLQKNLAVTNALKLDKGIILTQANKLQLKAGSLCTGGSDASHVNGTVEKAGNTAFTFPIGNGAVYRPCSISAPSDPTDAFAATYYGSSPRTTFTPATIHSAGTPPMLLVSDKEYWNIERTTGTATVRIGLNWKDVATSGIKNSDNDLVIASHNTGGWDNEGGSISSDPDFVWVTTSGPISQFGTFALGSTSPLTTLPLRFIYFHVAANRNSVSLNWNVAGEEGFGIKTFRILRSNDAIHFNQIGAIDKAVNYNRVYQFTDSKPVGGKNYYRIEMVNGNDHSSFSNVESCGFLKDQLTINCNNRIHVLIPYNLQSSACTLTISDQAGKVIHVKKLGNNTSNIEVHLPVSGIYYFMLSDTKGQVITGKQYFIPAE